MTTEENKIIRLQVYHSIMGTQNLQVNAKDNFSDLRVLLLENTPMTIFENFRFQLNNKILPEFQQVGQVIQSDAKINLVLQPFDQKSSLFHLEKVKNIISNPIQWALLNYNREQQQQYPQINDSIRQVLLPGISIDNFLDLMYTSSLQYSASKLQMINQQLNINNDLMSSEKEVSLKCNQDTYHFLEIMAFSQFNSALSSTNYYRKLSGDFFYLHIRTLQGKDFYITSNPEGFFINNSSCTHFNPSPITPHFVYYNLLDLLKTISPKFRENMESLKYLKFTEIQKSLFSSFHTKSETQYSSQWLRNSEVFTPPKSTQKNQHVYNFNYQNNPLYTSVLRNSCAQFDREVDKDSLNIKDWNQILQMHSSTPYDTDSQIATKNKFKLKLYQELANSIKDGAVKIVEGMVPNLANNYRRNVPNYTNGQIITKIDSVSSLKPENKNFHKTYQYGSLQFWLAEQSLHKYSEFQDFMPSKKTVNTQIRNLQMMQKLKLNNLNYQHIMLVKYKGHNIAAQTVIPGLQLMNNSKKIEDESPILKNQKEILLSLVAKTLKISQKTFYQKKTDETSSEICRAEIHPRINIVTGNDSRKYLTNLYSLSAHDLNFAGPENFSTYLRRQLIEIFQSQEQENKFKYTPINTMIKSQFDIIYNDKTNEQKSKLIELAAFARNSMIPACLKSFQGENRRYLGDSKSVTKIMHSYGLSSRYLGLMWKKSMSQKGSEHISIILERITLVKSLKSLFKKAMSQNKSGQLKILISWLLNCIFCSGTFPYGSERLFSSNFFSFSGLSQKDEERDKDQSQTTHSKKQRKRKNQNQKLQKQLEDIYFNFYVNKSDEGQISIGIKPQQLWKYIKKISHFKFGVEFKEDRIGEIRCLRSEFSKSAVLRDLCLSLGIIMERVQYFKKQGIIFRPENILDIRPIIKHINIQNENFNEIIKQSQKLLEMKKIEQAIDSYIKAIHFAMLNLGVMTDKFALIHKKLSQIYFRIGQIDAALLFAHHGEKMLEKFYGFDHIETLEIYMMLSQLYFVKRKFNAAEYYMLKTINLSMISYGEQYPELVSNFLNLSTIYQASQKFIDSISCNVKALNLSIRVFGENNLNTAVCYAAMSQVHFQIPDIQKSITFQLKAISILENLFKKNDPRLRQAQNTLQLYRSLQNSKKVKENHEKQRKRLSNSQLYNNFPLFKMPEYTWKQRENIYRKMQNLFGNQNRSLK